MSKLFDVEEVPAQEKKNNEWYTPVRYIEAAREVMGSIDLDPASSDVANEIVKATKYYTKKENGLVQEWNGRVWLNPPYGRTEGYESNIRLFIEKLIAEYQSGNVKEAILLTSCKVDASWFQMLWDYPVCFSDHNVRFARNYDTPGQPGRFTQGHMHGTIFVYLGPNVSKFVNVFTEFGPVVTPDGVHRREQTVQQPTLWDSQEAS